MLAKQEALWRLLSSKSIAKVLEDVLFQNVYDLTWIQKCVSSQKSLSIADKSSLIKTTVFLKGTFLKSAWPLFRLKLLLLSVPHVEKYRRGRL